MNTNIIRAWQAHTKEQKWFYVNSGSFLFVTARIDNFANPSENLDNKGWIISADDNTVLHVPGGFANGFKTLLTENSRLLVFSGSTLEESKADDYRFDPGFGLNGPSKVSYNIDFK